MVHQVVKMQKSWVSDLHKWIKNQKCQKEQEKIKAFTIAAIELGIWEQSYFLRPTWDFKGSWPMNSWVWNHHSQSSSTNQTHFRFTKSKLKSNSRGGSELQTDERDGDRDACMHARERWRSIPDVLPFFARSFARERERERWWRGFSQVVLSKGRRRSSHARPSHIRAGFRSSQSPRCPRWAITLKP